MDHVPPDQTVLGLICPHRTGQFRGNSYRLGKRELKVAGRHVLGAPIEMCPAIAQFSRKRESGPVSERLPNQIIGRHR
jgi:hypothetical protein